MTVACASSLKYVMCKWNVGVVGLACFWYVDYRYYMCVMCVLYMLFFVCVVCVCGLCVVSVVYRCEVDGWYYVTRYGVYVQCVRIVCVW